MKKNGIIILLSLLYSFSSLSQNFIQGTILNSNSKKPIEGVAVYIKKLSLERKTSFKGIFVFEGLPNGEYLLEVRKEGYSAQKYPIVLLGKRILLGELLMDEINDIKEPEMSTILISDEELDSERNSIDNISGLLQASKGIYLRAAAFDFSTSFFKIRGLNSENSKVLINGVEMNKFTTKKPLWSNWGGLNDVFRNQDFTSGLGASNVSFGGLLGTVNMNTRASEYRKRIKLSMATTNRSYQQRIMASYTSGMLKNGWAFAISAGKRIGEEGFVDGTLYDGNSLLISVENKMNDKHSINLTGIAAFSKRGKSSANTEEVYKLKGIKYNPYWGNQEGKKRNSRIKRVEEPLFLCNHYWTISNKASLNTNLLYQFGEIGNSRLEYNGRFLNKNVKDGEGNFFIGALGGVNPIPTYYKKLPSYSLRERYSNAYEVMQDFIQNGQLKWSELYEKNLGTKGNAAYILYEDRNDETQFVVNSILDVALTKHMQLNAKIKYQRVNSVNFAEVLDLLGGVGYLDIDPFGDTYESKQVNNLTPNRVVTRGNRFKYNYQLYANTIDGFIQAQFNYKKIDFYIAANMLKTTYQRKGMYKNGKYPNSSLGNSISLSFTGVKGKAGVTYKVNGRHLLELNGGYMVEVPNVQNTFINIRESNEVIPNVTEEKKLSADISYILRTPIVSGKLTGYYTHIKDMSEVSFYYVNGRSFSKEALVGIDKKNIGLELGVELNIMPTVNIKGVVGIGQYFYDSNPNLYLYYDGKRQFEGVSFLKNYRLAAGPHSAYSIGFEYKDPAYWFVGSTANYFSNAYVAIAPLARTAIFSLDPVDGLPFNDYEPAEAKRLLEQERFSDYLIINVIGGKSWRVGENRYIGLFVSVNNVLDTIYKTGGYEQRRNADYRGLKEDKALKNPIFGNQYWYGRGATYFVNLTYSF
ncbi:TonB-dependent outer membrane receptor [Tenacibaculum maritimum]|uniref:carboxypeptidase regulatory-like domain-containing protein n=1 Tax=Tenacibaculum maritimum TaxID=107401 RepID=UPI0012E5EBAC|nr:carboxypeptidase regulatory-like domain-containing protein [Tenacibaculum maritimum]CAA0150046.1 TonB-dependent outer membrane receptor [Tenacibaculum maritimum]